MSNRNKTAEAEPDQFAGKWSIVRLAAWLGLPQTTVHDIIARADLNGKGPYEIAPVVIAHYRTKAENEASEMAKDRARQVKADANRAEIAEAKDMGELVSRDGMKRKIEGLFVTMREKIKKMEGLTLEQKTAVCALLAGKLKEGDE